MCVAVSAHGVWIVGRVAEAEVAVGEAAGSSGAGTAVVPRAVNDDDRQ